MNKEKENEMQINGVSKETYIQKKAEEAIEKAGERTSKDIARFKILQESMEAVKAETSKINLENAAKFVKESQNYLKRMGIGRSIDTQA